MSLALRANNGTGVWDGLNEMILWYNTEINTLHEEI